MKRLFSALVVGAILLFATMVCAAPFLVCDPQNDATSYIVIINGIEEEVQYNEDGPDGSVLLKDLGSTPDGNYTVAVKAKNIWGQSIAVPFDFVKALPGVPSGVALHE